MEDYIHELLENTPTTHWIAVALLALLFAVQIYFYFKYYNKIIRHGKNVTENKVRYSNEHAPVSVIICAQNESENLARFLPSILEQNYPKYEVIVVNDGSTDESGDLLERLEKKHKHLKHTFLPMDAKFTSRKKMCLTIGIKAAEYDHLLLLDADCEPASKNWISQMMHNYTEGTDIVLGYSKHIVEDDFLGRIIRYDTLTSAIRHLGYALSGKPYRGVSQNLSYKKSLFNKGVGFSNQLNLVSGDDTLLIQQIADDKNTRVEVNSEAITLTYRKETLKTFVYQKDLRLKAFSQYKQRIKSSICIESISRTLFYLATAVLLVFFLLNRQWELSGIILLLFLFRFTTQAIIIQKSAKILTEKPFLWSIPVFDFILPLISAYIMTFGRIGSKRNDFARS